MNALECRFLENFINNGVVPAIEAKNAITKYNNIRTNNEKLINLFDDKICSLHNILQVLLNNTYEITNYTKSGDKLNYITVPLSVELLSVADQKYFKAKCYQYISNCLCDSNIIELDYNNDKTSLINMVVNKLIKSEDVFDFFYFIYTIYNRFYLEKRSLILFKIIKYLIINYMYASPNEIDYEIVDTKLYKVVMSIMINFGKSHYNKILINLFGYIYYLHYQSKYKIKNPSCFDWILQNYLFSFNGILDESKKLITYNESMKEHLTGVAKLTNSNNIVFFPNITLISKCISHHFNKFKNSFLNVQKNRYSYVLEQEKENLTQLFNNLNYLEMLSNLHNKIYMDSGHMLNEENCTMYDYVKEIDTNISMIFDLKIYALSDFLKYTFHEMLSFIFLRENNSKFFYMFLKQFKKYIRYNGYGVPRNFKRWIMINFKNEKVFPFLEIFENYSLSIKKEIDYKHEINKLFSAMRISLECKLNLPTDHKETQHKYNSGISTIHRILDKLYDNNLFIKFSEINETLNYLKKSYTCQYDKKLELLTPTINDLEEFCQVLGFPFLKFMKVIKLDNYY